MARFDGLFHIGFEIILEVEVNDFTARRHEIAHDAVAQVEHVHEQAASERRDFFRFFALLQDQAQFLFGVRQLRRRHRLPAQHGLQKKIRRFVQQPDGWFEHNVKRAQWPD